MDNQEWLAERFESHRIRLQAVAYRMLGSQVEADDAVQEAWFRLSRTDADAVKNLGGWLTTVVARVCLDMLRSRTSRREEPLLPESTGALASGETRNDPEYDTLLADSVGLALLVVLDRLAPAERVAFVLHDVFAVPFDEIAPIVDRTPGAAKKLASRARLRIHGTAPKPADGLNRNRHVVEAFLAAARSGDFDALLAVLDPDVVRRADPVALPAGAETVIRGARAVAAAARTFSDSTRFAQLAVIDGSVGIVVAPRGQLRVALSLTIRNDKITEIDVIADPRRLDRLDLAILES
jgi:RNA polymerase sigma factor (sigma-70 family)